jgi:hypothetical protein
VRYARAILVLVVATMTMYAQGPVIEVIPVGCRSCAVPMLPPPSAPPGLRLDPSQGGASPYLSDDLPVLKLGHKPHLAAEVVPLCDPNAGCIGCGRVPCVPGREPCKPCKSDHFAGKFFCALYESLCCPDPCYEPAWTPLADASMFTEAVRPVKQMRLRYDSAQHVPFPDRNEFLWPRADGRGKGPPAPANGLFRGETRLRYNDAVLITEGGTDALSIIVETRYRSQQAEQLGHSGGFTDVVLGTKTLMFDCELLQVSTLFKTFIPSGAFRKGLGTGHVSLEPSLLVGLKVGPTTYLQSQVSQWIPLGGDDAYAGGVLHYHFSLNHELCRLAPQFPLIGTLEHSSWWFQDGLYTDPVFGPQKSSGQGYHSLGAGLRLFFCDKWDFGFGASFGLGDDYRAREFYRTEFRMRF